MNNWPVKHAWLTIGFWVLLLAVAVAGMGRLTMVNDYKVFFSEENPDLTAFEQIEEKYSNNDSVLVVVAPKEGSVFQPEALSAVMAMTEKGWQTPHSYRVDSLSNYQYTQADGDDLLVEDFIQDFELGSPQTLATKQDYALRQPELVNRIIAKNGQATAVNVLIRLPGDSQTEEVREVAAYWQAEIEQLKAEYTGLDFYLTGQIMQNDAFGEATQRDMGSLVPLALLLIIIGTGLYLRSFLSSFLVTLAIISSIMLALGMAGWFGIPITSVSASAPLIILTVAVADCIHFLQGYRKGRLSGQEKVESIIQSLSANRLPIVLTSITTAVGFLSMNFSDSPPFRDLGNITAFGVFWAMLISLTLLPALLKILPGGKTKEAREVPLSQPLANLAQWATARPGLLLVLLLVISGLVAVNIQKNNVDDTLFEYFDDSYHIRQANDFTYANLTGVASIQYAIKSPEGEKVTSPEFLAKLDDFVKAARNDSGVYHVQSLTDIMKRLNSSLHGDDPAWFRLPDDARLSAQTLLLYDMSLPYGLTLNNQVALDKQELRIIVTARKMSSNNLLALEDRLRQHLLAKFDASQISPGVSADIIFAHIGYNNNISMLTASAAALLIISLLIGILLRSVRLGLVSVLPNILPASIAFGVWGLTVGEVGLSLSVIASMTLGIVVDDTIHLLHRYKRAREDGLSEQNSIITSVRETGVAITGTTIVLCTGFFVLASSSFKLNADMGLMTAVTILIALVLDLLLVPALLKLTASKSGD